ncbi:MAG: hypothetical protein ABFQ62_02350 [Patescibacteria group bacterium]
MKNTMVRQQTKRQKSNATGIWGNKNQLFKDKSLSQAIIISLTSKLFLTLTLVISFYLFPQRTNFNYTQFVLFTQKLNTFVNFLLGAWANFDGIHYLSIAGRGYVDEGRFLPLYPILIKIFSFNAPAYSVLQLIIAQLISFTSLIIFFKYLNKLIKLDFNSYQISNILYLILLFPTSFFLLSIYAESLFLATTVLSFYFARKKHWRRAALFASLTSITRLTGIVVILVILYEFLVLEKILRKQFVKSFSQIKKNYINILFFILSFFPISIYSYFNYLKWQDPLYFIHAHSQLANSRSTSTLINPIRTIFRYFKIIFTFDFSIYEYWIATLELGVFFFAIFLIYKLWQKKIRVSYLIYSIFSLLLPILSGTFSGLPRYMLTIFPIFIILGQINFRKIKFLYYMISGSLLIILFLLFSRGYFVA